MVTLAEYKKALGTKANGLTDAELQQRLAYTECFAEAFYGWWHKRKDYRRDMFGGRYTIDTLADFERREREIALGKPLEKVESPFTLAEGDGWVETIVYLEPCGYDVQMMKTLWKMTKQELSR